MCSSNDILKEIECLREKMTEIVKEQGFTSERVVSISQQIDSLLNKYNRQNNRNT